MDTLDSFTKEQVGHLKARFKGLNAKLRINYIIAMGLEGFTPEEIRALTEMESDDIEEILTLAGVVGS